MVDLKNSIAVVEMTLVPSREIYMDHEFNCRSSLDNDRQLEELKVSIDKRGLDIAIVIRPMEREEQGTKYDVVAGFRRLTVCRELGMTIIPSKIVKMTDEEARILNLRENVQRKNLDMVEEAQALRPFFAEGLTYKEISEKVGMSNGWIQNRKSLLQLPANIQNLARKKGMFDSNQLRQMYNMEEEELYAFVRKCTDWFESGQKNSRPKPPAVRKRNAPAQPKTRDLKEIQNMMLRVYKVFGNESPGANFATKAMSWCSGGIDEYEFLKALKAFGKLDGFEYEIPEDIAREAALEDMENSLT